MKIQIPTEGAMQNYGEKLARQLHGGEVIELIGDIGAGKTTLVKGIGRGLVIEDVIQSPTFTINRTYEARDGLRLMHYDFYRLAEAGVMMHDVAESVGDPHTITIIEWADAVQGVLPARRMQIRFTSPTETQRELSVTQLQSGTNESDEL